MILIAFGLELRTTALPNSNKTASVVTKEYYSYLIDKLIAC